MEKNYLCLQCGAKLIRQAENVAGIEDSDLNCPVCGGNNVVSLRPDAFFGSLMQGAGGG